MMEHRKRKFVAIVGFLFLVLWIKIQVETDNVNISPSEMEMKQRVELSWDEQSNFFNKTLEGTGVIFKSHGGLGNQLFLYACSYALARDRQCPLYNFVDKETISLLTTGARKFQVRNREFALDMFEVPINNLIDNSTEFKLPSPIALVTDKQLLFKDFSNDPFLQPSRRSYCTSELYWREYKDEILAMFQFKPEVINKLLDHPPIVRSFLEDIEDSEESVAVHVRRGDLFNIKGMDIPISFQRLAIRKISKMILERPGNNFSDAGSPKFFVFSDDIEYAKLKFNDLAEHHEFLFVSASPEIKNGLGTSSLQDFFLMIKCKHFIIPNSTFAWWAAYLSTESTGVPSWKSGRIVIASAHNPGYWQHWDNKEDQKFYKMLHTQIYHLKHWIIVDPFVGEHWK